MAATGRSADSGLRQALYGPRAPGRARLRFRLPEKSLVRFVRRYHFQAKVLGTTHNAAHRSGRAAATPKRTDAPGMKVRLPPQWAEGETRLRPICDERRRYRFKTLSQLIVVLASLKLRPSLRQPAESLRRPPACEGRYENYPPMKNRALISEISGM